MHRACLATIALFFAACGGASGEAEAPPPAPPPPPPPAQVAAPPTAPPGTLARKDLVAFIDAGFPRFLQMVEVEPSLENGQFRGWSIVSLRPPEFWQHAELKPGDVVTAVNGKRIERETEAFDVFQSLRGAAKLTVSYQRAGTARTLEYRIVDEPSVAK